MATPIPDNAAAFTLAEIAAASGGQIRPGASSSVRGVTTDSRGAVAGKLFVALSGESFDGHAFARAAVERGAAAVVIERPVELPEHATVVRVDSTLSTLGALARLHRRRWGGPVVAIGGSAGKTTTKSATAAALEASCPGAVHVSAGNLNNLVGVPMVLLGLEATHQVAVVEVGTNQRGEVARLATVCEPDVAVLTLIAIEHAAGIGDLDAIEAEEGDLFAALGSAGTAIGNGNDERVVRRLRASSAATQLTYGTGDGADYRVVRREPMGLGASRIAIERPAGARLDLTVPLVGIPGALAAAAACAVADRIAGSPLAPELLARALAAIASEPGRLGPIELADGTVLIDDTYNANPASVIAAVEAAREIARSRGARLVLAIGEMRELGPLSASEHASLGARLAESGAAALVAIGGDAAHFLDSAGAGMDSEFVPDALQAIPALRARIRPGDVVLVKASRGIRAERVVEALSATGSAA
jgi:UDP-N-acetylmuramoyl-tripeptide--D-alanyl-D-alanine ligase